MVAFPSQSFLRNLVPPTCFFEVVELYFVLNLVSLKDIPPFDLSLVFHRCRDFAREPSLSLLTETQHFLSHVGDQGRY